MDQNIANGRARLCQLFIARGGCGIAEWLVPACMLLATLQLPNKREPKNPDRGLQEWKMKMLKKIAFVMFMSACAPSVYSDLETGSDGRPTYYNSPAISLVCDQPESADQKRLKVNDELDALLGDRYYFTSSDPQWQSIELRVGDNGFELSKYGNSIAERFMNREVRFYGLNGGCFARLLGYDVGIGQFGTVIFTGGSPFSGMSDAVRGSIILSSHKLRSPDVGEGYYALVRDGRLSIR